MAYSFTEELDDDDDDNDEYISPPVMVNFSFQTVVKLFMGVAGKELKKCLKLNTLCFIISSRFFFCII